MVALGALSMHAGYYCQALVVSSPYVFDKDHLNDEYNTVSVNSIQILLKRLQERSWTL